MHVPSDKVGLYPVRLVIGELDDLGNPLVKVSFDLHADDGSLLRGFQFLSVDVSGILTSIADQRLDAQRIGAQGADALLTSTDATLATVSDPDAPATIGLSTQRVRLFLGGFQFAEWQVTFETGIDPFQLDGRWV
jgi:hypothetical protein